MTDKTGGPAEVRPKNCAVCGGDPRLTGCYRGHCEDKIRADAAMLSHRKENGESDG